MNLDHTGIEPTKGIPEQQNSVVVIMSECKVNDESHSIKDTSEIVVRHEIGMQDVSEAVARQNDNVSIQDAVEEVGSEDAVSILSRKRRHSEEEVTINEVSTPKRVHKVSSSRKAAHGHDHTYHINKSSRRLKQQVDDLVNKLKKLQNSYKVSKQKTRRLKRKVSTLASVASELQKKQLINSDCAAILETTFSGVPKELMKRLVSQIVKKNPGAYPPELRSFALTLKFYSTKAYNYVRKSFNLGLPHVSVIPSWYTSMDGEPGFTKDALTAMKAQVLAAKRDGKEVICSLMLDEMSIRKHVEWDGKRMRGYVDLGTGIDDDSLPEATDALVFMAVCVNSGWKIPCGYFLVDGLTGEEKANLTKECITKLHEVGVKVVSFTCDGPTSHQAMLKILGAKLSPDSLLAYFEHPCDPNAKVYVFLDACHMIKLVRNTISDWQVLKDKDGNSITWEFIEKLHKLQESEGLHLANKLRAAHVKWKPEKMKVNLAAQALSSSVADALEYCEGKLKLPQYQGCGPTVKFIRVFDHAFDVLNSRNALAKNFKARSGNRLMNTRRSS